MKFVDYQLKDKYNLYDAMESALWMSWEYQTFACVSSDGNGYNISNIKNIITEKIFFRAEKGEIFPYLFEGGYKKTWAVFLLKQGFDYKKKNLLELEEVIYSFTERR